ncbi:hypothetical protein EDD70_0634 [Hydrogenoanaerobacterium saccharovorans]|uniref:Uncharacterized protein n=1 Tax=Hydrogenoanaerobacterium saccharovorans TaxID=474960 RepID=A0A1H8AR89_9FIRM|nr:DUF6809 family protein [Hydrogenoanaerobacterium saccharovorans]RPF47834.1 hypothetical protein EDD70_0634 [Hydrogenoanaerobacterium saccharovorans]SEM72338.1 hypothetical protein SAMN05216180_1457 [Hydrogenoanaerobacterium saccharovorans]
MPNRLDDLYHSFYKPIEQTELKSSIEENHKKLIQILSKEDKVLVLRIIDALEMICNYQSKDSFIQGFKLGFELTNELQSYNDHSFEKENLNDCGQFFMSQEVQKDEEN